MKLWHFMIFLRFFFVTVPLLRKKYFASTNNVFSYFPTSNYTNYASIRLFSSKSQLTHTNEEGKARMIDVSSKDETIRTATAKAIVEISKELTKLIKENNLKKGDVFSVAQLAGIMGAKKTSELIPLCHNIPLTNVKLTVSLNENENCVVILATVKCLGRTGVEMEALTAASMSALAVYDMCKAVSHDITISVNLINKTGGTRGDYNKNVIKIRNYDTTPIVKEAVVLNAL